MITAIGITVGVLLALTALYIISLRRVVDTNEVHIVQYRKKTLSYGKDTQNGNVYYEIPDFVPIFGVRKVVLPVSIFELTLKDYEAYDQGRLPFEVDITSFFRITDSNVAAQRVANFGELHDQLRAVVQGAVRSVLASSDIETIMEGRSTFGEKFTKEVDGQLKDWGVSTVKNLELMDIRDTQDSRVINNIMDKKKSFIAMESRVEVAENKRKAEITETNALRDVEVTKQEAAQAIGLKTVQNKKEVSLADQKAQQEVKEQEKVTKEKEMQVVRVAETRKADIDKEVQVVNAQAIKEAVTLKADGDLASKEREAKGIKAEGTARAEAQKLMDLAPVQAQIDLAKEIGSNEKYQQYLISVEKIKAGQEVGIAQASALEKAEVKVISNTGDAVKGVSNVMDLFTSEGGTKVGAMLEALKQTDTGKHLLGKVNPANK